LHLLARIASAIFEQIDNCRAWVSAPPQLQPNSARRLIKRLPRFDSAERLMASVTLEPPCLARLMARVARVRDWSE
jgi:hypothetical protein